MTFKYLQISNLLEKLYTPTVAFVKLKLLLTYLYPRRKVGTILFYLHKH